jgi:hypothetical protein
MTVVKVVRLLASADPTPLGEALRSRWTRALAGGGDTRADPAAPGRPRRVALAEPLDLSGFPPAPFAAVDSQWFADVAGAQANEAWLRAADPGLCVGSPLLGDGSLQLITEELVLRGQDHYAARWEQGGERYKMMSFGRRNPALTPTEFSARWRSHAGRLGADEIPDEVRGLAYVQNHPVALDGRDWPLDAVNEVYFERLDHLRRRAEWFAARQEPAQRTEAESLMAPTGTGSLYLRETPVAPD